MAARSTPIKDIEFKYNLGIYLSFIKKYKLMFFSIIFVIFLMESLHLTEKLLFKLIIDRGTEFTALTITKEAFIQSLITIATYFIIITAFLIIFYWMRPHLLNRLNSKVINDLKKRFFNHIIYLDHNFHTTHKTGSLISRLTRGASAVERMTDIIAFNFMPLIIQLIIVSTTIAFFDTTAVIIILGITLALLSYSFIIQRFQEKSSIVANKKEDIEKGNMADFFTNVDSIKYYGKEGSFLLRQGIWFSFFLILFYTFFEVITSFI